MAGLQAVAHGDERLPTPGTEYHILVSLNRMKKYY